MPQDRLSGAEAEEFGHEFGRRVAAAIGAEMLGTSSNECLLNGEQVVIKCARLHCRTVGVTDKMMERIRAVLGVFEQDGGSYAVWRLSVERYIQLSRHRIPDGGATTAGQQGMVNFSDFEREGEFVATVRP